MTAMKSHESGGGGPAAFLDRGIAVEGLIRFQQSLRVAGQIKGQVEGGEELVVDPGGRIEGAVKVKKLFVRGTVTGEEITVDRLEIYPQGRVEGNIKTRTLVIQEGGILQAQCEMTSPNPPGPSGSGRKP